MYLIVGNVFVRLCIVCIVGARELFMEMMSAPLSRLTKDGCYTHAQQKQVSCLFAFVADETWIIPSLW